MVEKDLENDNSTEYIISKQPIQILTGQSRFDMMGIKGDGEQGKATVGLNTNKRTHTLNPRDSNRHSICFGSDWVWTLLMVR